MRFTITAVNHRGVGDGEGQPMPLVGMTVERSPDDGPIQDGAFELGMDVEIAAFETAPGMTRYLAAVSEARLAKKAQGEELTSLAEIHQERVMDLLLGKIDP